MSESERATGEVRRERAVLAPRPRQLTPGELAWVVLIPCAIATLLAIAVVGPPIGRALFRPGTDVLWPHGWWETRGHPEPVKQGRYLVALAGPLALTASIVVLAPRRPRLSPRAIRALVLAGQASVAALVLVAVLGQRSVILVEEAHPPLLSIRDFVIAGMLVTAAAIACRRRGVVAWVGRLARERRLTRFACVAIAVGFTILWVFATVRDDGLTEDYGKMSWVPNGAYAVLDGRTTLVDVHVIYAKLLPYPTALVMAAFGTSAFVFTTFMAILTLVTLLAVYAVYRRIVGSAFALLLFLPFVAFSDTFYLFPLGSIWPMRYLGPYLLAWLTARHLDGRSPRRPWAVFFVGGLAAIDMLDFGLAALLGSIAALMFARPPGSARDVGRLAREVAVGVLAAAAAVTAFTLVRAGEPPSVGILLEWSRIFTGLGWFSVPVPRANLALAIYATLAAAIVVAAVRLVRRADDALLTGMLAWSGVFGLVAGNYYVARADDLKLAAMFSAWGLALGLLTIVCVRALTVRAWRAPSLAELLVLFGFAVSVCTIGRLQDGPANVITDLRVSPQSTYRPMAKSFVAAYTRRGEKVAILLPEGYRIAYELGLDDISPYEMQNAIVTRRQISTEIDTIEREHVRTVFTPEPGSKVVGDAEAAPEQLQLLVAAGFQPIMTANQMIAWNKPG